MNKIIKNKFVIFLLIICMLVPTVVAIVNYNMEKDGPASTQSVVSMVISDLNGVSTTLTKDTEDGVKMIDLFLELSSTATSVTSLPEPLRTAPFYLVEMTNGEMTTKYQYYFDTTGAESYFTDSNGDAFKLSEKSAVAFLQTTYGSSVFGSSELPELAMVGAEKSITPSAVTWYYKNQSGEFTTVNSESYITSETVVYTADGGLSLSFTNNPDYFHISVKNKDDGASLFDGLYEDISSLTFTSEAQILVDVSAKWYEDSTRDYYGELSYSFGAEIGAPPEFKLNLTSINLGEFVGVTALNVNDASKIEFSSSPEIDFTPVFYKDGEVLRAFIPVGLDNKAGSYKFKFTYGTAVCEADLTVEDRTLRKTDITLDDDVIALYTDENRAAMNSAFEPVLAKGSEKRFMDTSDFSMPFPYGNISRYYGRIYSANGEKLSFREEGVEYKASAGSNAIAAANGEVVFAGETALTGKTVIIEHGFGLKTMYGHLSEVSVTVGDTVNKDSVVGKCGSTGLASEDGLYFAMFVGDVEVCPYVTFSDRDWPSAPYNFE